MSTKVQKSLSPLYLSIGAYRVQIDFIKNFISSVHIAQCDFARYFGLDSTYFCKVVTGRVIINGAILCWILYTSRSHPSLIIDFCLKCSATQRIRSRLNVQ